MFECIPDELKSTLSWVNVWNTSKIPMQTTIVKGASASKPDTWGTFADAVANVERGTYDGIGYVFHDSGLVGIDIDAGRDEDGFLSPLAVDIIRACASYTEWSRSGRGVHIILRGSLPFRGRNNRAGVEIYKTARYFITTGKVLFFHDICQNQEAIDYVVGKYFPDAPTESETGIGTRIYSPKFAPPRNGIVQLRPQYPPIPKGCRNLSLASLAGQMHSQGYNKMAIAKELMHVNATACDPPLPLSEIESIVESITKYKR